MYTPMMEIVDDDDDDDADGYAVNTHLNVDDNNDEENVLDRSIFHSCSASDQFNGEPTDEINDLLALSSLMSHHVESDHFLASESSLIRSKFLRLFHFLLTDTEHEPMAQASGDTIATADQVDDALINLNRNATLKFRNYKQFRELVGLLLHPSVTCCICRSQLNIASPNVEPSSPSRRPQLKKIRLNHQFWFRSRDLLRYYAHRLIQNRIFTWFISMMICLDAVSSNDVRTLSMPS